jgi:hypothetical protein
MRRPATLVLSVFVLLFAIVALAQPKKGAKEDKKAAAAAAKEEKDKKEKEDKEKAESAEAGAPAPADTESAGDDLGDPPPKTTKQDDKTKPSPLTPKPEEFPDGGAAPAPAEYDKLLGDIAALRSRVAALTTTLFKSKLRVLVETEGDDARITSFRVTVDDGVVYVAGESFSAEDERTVYEHAVAPGHHVLGVEIERVDARNREYKTWQVTKMSIVVPESKVLEALVSLEDDSGMAEDFPDDQDGEYELNVKLRARVAE